MKGFIKRLLREGSYDKPVKYGKDIVDRIREINPSIDKELDNSIFSKSDKVYCKGGAARLALLIFCDIDNNGGLHGSDIIRDSDFVYIGDYNRSVDIGEVEFIDSYDKYFSSRDITLNEVLLSPTELIFTRRAYRDGNKEVINPSKSSNTEGKYKVVDGRLLARMFLFASRYGYKPVATLKYKYDENDTYINFDILVCLLKAYELGIEDKYFRMFKEYCDNFNFNDFGSWLASLITINFDFFGREDLLINDLSKINDSEIGDYLDEYFYKYYPELKKKVNRLKLDDNDFNEYLTKPNRGEQNLKMRRSVNMSLAESIKRLLREGELKRSNFKTEWEYQEAYYNQKNSKLKKFAIKNLDELVKVEGSGTYELLRGSKDGNQNIGAGIYAYGIHYTNDIKTANEFGDPTNFKVKLKNPKIVDVANVKSDGLHAEERTNVLKSEGYDSLVVKHKKIYTVYGTDMIYELPYIEYEVIKF